MRLGVTALAAVLLLLAAGAREVDAADESISLQEAILRAKPATVLIVSEVASAVTLNCGAGEIEVTPNPFRETGTGWFLDSNGWVMTNAHVVQPAHTTPRWLANDQAQRAVVAACVWPELRRQGIGVGQRPDVEDQLRRRALDRALPTARVELKPSIFILMSNGFRLPAKVAKYSPPVSTESGAGVMSGRDLALLQVEASEMPAFKLAESKNVKIGDPIHILGYPGVVLTHELLNSTAKVEASVTNGAISGFKQDVQNQSVIQTDAPAAWGNSGGPAVNSRGDIVGVLTFVSLAPGPEGAIVQGFNFIIPADAVKEFLRGTPVDLADRSPFNEKWFAGLRKFFGGDWKGAAAGFRDANRLQPEFPDVKRMLAEAEEKIKNPPPRPFPWAWAWAAVTLAGLGAVGVMYVRRLGSSRFRVSPAEVVRLFESGSPPVILDVRAPFAYGLSPFRIPGSLHVSPDDLEREATSLSIDHARTVVAYCTSEAERASTEVARRLRGLGFGDVRILRGGLGGWTNAGLPLEAKPTGGEPA
ncbi:MAG: trypsin-like peptidase domain-containing protein [Candidatus Rokubacteria bacterium]|nr:trypsin-like peptidase domain-containing protein [Candidatus Rokubacteria bacterium]